jgi:hypothetical protein
VVVGMVEEETAVGVVDKAAANGPSLTRGHRLPV